LEVKNMGNVADKKEGKSVSRRDFIRLSSIFVAGAAVGTSGLTGVSSFAQDAKSTEVTMQ
jgi:hypothetical protein